MHKSDFKNVISDFHIKYGIFNKTTNALIKAKSDVDCQQYISNKYCISIFWNNDDSSYQNAFQWHFQSP